MFRFFYRNKYMKLKSYYKYFSIFIFVAVQAVTVDVCLGQDSFEIDDTYTEANVITPDDSSPQHHTIHVEEDVDWVRFYALADERYEIKAYSLTPEMDAIIELYEPDGVTKIVEKDNPAYPNVDEALDWYCTVEGVYYVKVGHASPQDWAEGAEYDLLIHDPSLFSLPEYLTGRVLSGGGKAIANAVIKLTGSEDSGSGISLNDGSFLASVKEGSYTVSVIANGYQSTSKTGVAVPGSVNFALNTFPVAIDDFTETTRGGTVSGNVLVNDLDEDNDTLTAVLDTGVAHGTLNLDATGQFTYTHNGGNDKQDNFTYHASDGRANSSPATVTISIDHVPLTFLMLLMKK